MVLTQTLKTWPFERLTFSDGIVLAMRQLIGFSFLRFMAFIAFFMAFIALGALLAFIAIASSNGRRRAKQSVR